MFVPKDDYKEHFSNCWQQDPHGFGIVLPRYFDPGVIARLIHLSQKIDWDTDTLTKHDILDNYEPAKVDAWCALRLCVRMYKKGELVGWHSSSRNWLMGQLGWILDWNAWTKNRPYGTPKVQTRDEVTRHFVEAARYVCRETRTGDSCIREKVVEVLKEMLRVCRDEDPDRFNVGMLNDLVKYMPGVRADLDMA